jgi:hypothetical protein
MLNETEIKLVVEAVKDGNLEAVKYFVEKGEKGETETNIQDQSEMLLVLSLDEGQLEVAKFLVQRSPEFSDEYCEDVVSCYEDILDGFFNDKSELLEYFKS